VTNLNWLVFRTKRSRVIVNDGTWDCSLCTYKNPNVAFRCEMCDSRKGTATRKPKLIVNDPVERLPRSKRKTDDDYSSDGSTSDESDGQEDDDDDDDEEFQHEERKQSHQTRRSLPNDHLNENMSSPESSTRSFRSASPSSSSKTRRRTGVSSSLSRSTKSTSSITTNRNKNNQSNKNKSTKSKPSNEINQKPKTNRKNPNQQKKYSIFYSDLFKFVFVFRKKTKLSSLSPMSSSSSTSSNSSSTHTTTTITVDGVSVRITELTNHDTTTANTTNDLRASSSSSPAHSQSDK